MKTRALFAVVALLAACPACMTTSEGDKLRAELHDLKARMDKRETETSDKVDKLDQAIAEATKILGRGSADVGAQVVELQQKMGELTGPLEEAKHISEELKKSFDDYRAAVSARMAEIEAKINAAPVRPPGPPDDKNALFDGAYKKLGDKDYAGARSWFASFLQKFPDDDRADNAQFWIAESYFNERDFARAIGEYQKVIDRFPKGDTADDAFFKNGLSAAEMKWCSDAKAYLEALIKRFPTSPLVGDAKAKVKELDKASKDKKKCTS
jgi:tol-pal system protein YbgF